MPVPPPTEQTAILEFVDRRLSVAETTGARTQREIESLNEYRTRLIADLVTGKLDVREAAAELPEVVLVAAEEDPRHDAGSERTGWRDGATEGDSPAVRRSTNSSSGSRASTNSRCGRCWNMKQRR